MTLRRDCNYRDEYIEFDLGRHTLAVIQDTENDDAWIQSSVTVEVSR